MSYDFTRLLSSYKIVLLFSEPVTTRQRTKDVENVAYYDNQTLGYPTHISGT